MNIIELAKQANGEPARPGGVDWAWGELEHFAALVAAQEREEDCVGWFGYDTALRLWFETNKGDDGAIPLYKARSAT